MRRILLIKPYRPERLWVTTQPLGIMAVAAYLRRAAEERGEQLEFMLRDLNPGRELPEDVMDEIIAFRPDVVGISCLSVESMAAHALSREVKKHLPHVPIVIGGPYPSHDIKMAMEDENIDFGVINEGEVTFDDLLDTLWNGGDVSTVKGIAYRDEQGNMVQTPPRPFIEDLDSLPMPAYDLIDMKGFFTAPRHSRLYAHREYMSISSTRGCPFQCSYCHVTLGKKTRFRSAEVVVDEVQHLVENYGIKEIQWSDDIWNLDKDRAKKICDLLVERGIDIKMAWPNGVRGDLIDDELLDKMKAAGSYMIVFAPESGSKRVQRYIKKNARIDTLKEVVRKASERGIYCHGYFMVGFPTETESEMRETFDWALSSRLNSCSFFIVNAHPGTVLYEQAKAEGLDVDYAATSHNYMDPDFSLSEVPTPKLRRMMRTTYLRFLLNPVRIWRTLRAVPRVSILGSLVWDLLHRLFRDFRGQELDSYDAEGIPDYERLRILRDQGSYNRI